MGTSSMEGRCGCIKTRLLEPDEDVWITWQVCATHYRGTVDDTMAVQAMKNRRVYDAQERKAARREKLR
jgi:hypothetical protein